MTRWTFADIPDLSGKRALVTGAASGLGLETAAKLALHGAQVTLADRNVEGGGKAVQAIRQLSPRGEAVFEALDLADLDAVRHFAGEVNSKGQALDILVNNAGILPSLDRRTTQQGFELAFGIGYLGHFALTGLLLPSLMRASDARVVSVSSIVQAYAKIDFDDLQAKQRYEPQRAYSQTKLAALMFALDLSRRAGSRLSSLAAHPGVARTGLGDSRMREVPRRLRDRAEAWAYRGMMRWFGQAADQGALPILYAATAPEAINGGFYGPDGFRQFSGWPASVQPSNAALDATAAQRLWDIAEQLTGVPYNFKV